MTNGIQTVVSFIGEFIKIDDLKKMEVDEIKARLCLALELVQAVDDDEDFELVTVEELSDAIFAS